ncbi:hypothetical protein JXA85_02855 [Candidatus Woesearchaeota archaeon]|nr:hypothetical protein [Candidatus Woesearchaeota archaeon]
MKGELFSGKYALRTKTEAHNLFKKLVLDNISALFQDGTIDVEAALDCIVRRLERELSMKSKQESVISFDARNILLDTYKSTFRPAREDFVLSPATKEINEITVTQPGIDAWKLLRLCYLGEGELERLLEDDGVQVIYLPYGPNRHYLVEGNTRLLYLELIGKSRLPVNLIRIRGHNDLAHQVFCDYSRTSNTISPEQRPSVELLKKAFYNSIIEMAKSNKPSKIITKRVLDVKQLSFQEMLFLEKYTSQKRLLAHISLRDILDLFPKELREELTLTSYKVALLTPTQTGIEREKYDRIGRLHAWDDKSTPFIKKGQTFSLADVPAVVLSNLDDPYHRRLLLAGHARARYLIDINPDASIQAFLIRCYDPHTTYRWSSVADQMAAQNIRTVKDLPFV